MRLKFTKSIGFKMAVASALGLFTVLSLFLHLSLSYTERGLLGMAENESKKMVDVLEESLREAMLSGEKGRMNAVVSAVGQEPMIEDIKIMSLDGKIKWAKNQAEIGDVADRSNTENCRKCHNGKLPGKEDLSALFTKNNGERTLLNIRLIRNSVECRKCHTSGNRFLGKLYVAVTMKDADAFVSGNRRILFAVAVLTLLFSTAIIMLLFSRLAGRPLGELLHKMAEVEKGRLDVSMEVRGEDEIASLTGKFNSMLNAVRKYHEIKVEKETMEAVSAEKSRFLANMSHEIRTPMTAIIGMTELTLETGLTSKQRKNLETVKRAAEALLSLLNGVLDMSKIESGKMELENIEFNIHDVVQATVHLFSAQALDKGIALEYEIAPDVPVKLTGDPTRKRQVLSNLIANALKFTEQGKIDVCVSALSVEGCNGGEDIRVIDLLFTIRDTGIGIPRDKHCLIFENFSQADASTTRKYGGTGLGLSICRELVKMMKGSIWVESEEWTGSIFYFTAEVGVCGQNQIVKKKPAKLEPRSVTYS
ncbi:MAG: HAMP domain-containing protein [Nitrospirae bacterium]|nr:MAG: HAMP domain-containing protein [Nitrospirota bacterium]